MINGTGISRRIIWGIVVSTSLAIALTGCANEEPVNPVSGMTVEASANVRTATSADDTPVAPPVVDEDSHGEHELNAEETEQARVAAESFARLLVDRTMPVEDWRAAVTARMYSANMKELYSQLDAYKLPFCTPVSSVEVSAYGTFSYGFKVRFGDTANILIIEIMDVSATPGVPDYQVLALDNQMSDSGGC